jgi:hypothetical protein
MIGGFKWLFLFSADSISRQLKQKQSLMTDSTWPIVLIGHRAGKQPHAAI